MLNIDLNAYKNIWETSDLHLRHKNIIKYCPKTRGKFSSVDEMTLSIIDEWNTKVGPDDLIFHLGDFAFAHNIHSVRDIIHNLSGHKVFLFGNHDKPALFEGLDIMTGYYQELKYKGHFIVMHHYPLESWNKMHYGSQMHHGHTHNTIRQFGRRMDVGYDNEGKIYSLDELVERLADKPIENSGDHHGAS